MKRNKKGKKAHASGHKHLKAGGGILYGCSDMHRFFTIYFSNPCFWVLMVLDKHAEGNLLLLLVFSTSQGRKFQVVGRWDRGED